MAGMSRGRAGSGGINDADTEAWALNRGNRRQAWSNGGARSACISSRRPMRRCSVLIAPRAAGHCGRRGRRPRRCRPPGSRLRPALISPATCRPSSHRRTGRCPGTGSRRRRSAPRYPAGRTRATAARPASAAQGGVARQVRNGAATPSSVRGGQSDAQRWRAGTAFTLACHCGGRRAHDLCHGLLAGTVVRLDVAKAARTDRPPLAPVTALGLLAARRSRSPGRVGQGDVPLVRRRNAAILALVAPGAKLSGVQR